MRGQGGAVHRKRFAAKGDKNFGDHSIQVPDVHHHSGSFIQFAFDMYFKLIIVRWSLRRKVLPLLAQHGKSLAPGQPHHAYKSNPPSTVRMDPVVHEEASLNRNQAASAISSGRPMRPKGTKAWA